MRVPGRFALAVLALIASARASAQQPATLADGAPGVRIAGALAGGMDTDLLVVELHSSVLRFDRVRTPAATIAVSVTRDLAGGQRVGIAGRVGRGSVVSGHLTDMDGRGSWARVQAATVVGELASAAEVMGYVRTPVPGHPVEVGLVMGWSRRGRRFRFVNGIQKRPEFARLHGLNSTYEATLEGLSVALESRGFTEWGRAWLRVGYFYGGYRAHGNWNLRSDLRHPVSFENTSTGHGATLEAGVVVPIRGRLVAEAAVWRAAARSDKGRDVIHYAFRRPAHLALGGFRWVTRGVRLSVGLSP